MKTFLLVTGLLMTGASVYGIVDYNKKADTKEFKQLYKEAPVEPKVASDKPVEPVMIEKEIIKTEEAPKNEAAPAKKATKKKEPRKLRLKKFSREALG